MGKIILEKRNRTEERRRLKKRDGSRGNKWKTS